MKKVIREMTNTEIAPAAQAGMLDWALHYAKSGFAVFPVHTASNGTCSCGKSGCDRPGKHPIANLASHGFKDATRNEKIIRQWWTTRPDANIGIATGQKSNLIVVDIDGSKGEAKLAELVKLHGPLCKTMEVKTGRDGGGRHLYFGCPEGIKHIKGSAKAWLDIRADGGYVVAPPSLHTFGRRYEFANNVDMADAPQWIVDYARGGLNNGHARKSPGMRSTGSQSEQHRLNIRPRNSIGSSAR